jgi:hypothetical protein
MTLSSGRSAAALLALILGGAPVHAQATDSVPARPADVASIDSILTALYATISGPAGRPRQWDRFFSLFHPQARLIPSRCPPSAPCSALVMSPAEYRQRADSILVTEGFNERELARRTERYGAIAQTFSSYASFRRGEATPFARGINSIQLFWDGQRWWIMTIFWDSERPNNPLPTDMQGIR